MRNLNDLAKYRNVQAERTLYGGDGNEFCGFFEIPFNNTIFRVIATSGLGWDHVSISLKHRCPTWEEMDKLYRKVFKPDEHAMQLHLPASEHISAHPYCLHLWRPHDGYIPLPPPSFVGPQK